MSKIIVLSFVSFMVYCNGLADAQGRFLKIDHITWWVGNAKQAAESFCIRMGFRPFAYQGLSTNESEVASHAVINGDIVHVFKSSYNSTNEAMGDHLVKHGDGVRDVAIEVVHLDAIVSMLKEKGVNLLDGGILERSDEGGKVRFLRVQPFGDTVHTLVERGAYKGLFLPGYHPEPEKDDLLQNLPNIELGIIDHVVEAIPDQGGEDLVNWYTQNLMFMEFTGPDDLVKHQNYSSQKTRVVVNKEDTRLVVNIIEKAKGFVKGGVEVFVEGYEGAGIQHVAFTTNNIVETVRKMRYRGQQFRDIPDAYYDNIKIALKDSPVEIKESIDLLQELRILIDYDDHGYLLQIFTKHIQDRTSVFLEVIQRNNFEGFGAGNLQRLFEALQMEEGKNGKLPTYEEMAFVGN